MNLGQSGFRERKAALASDFSIKTGLSYFLQVKTHFDDSGKLIASPLMGGGSGDHANLIESDGFIELPANTYNFYKDQTFSLIPFREL